MRLTYQLVNALTSFGPSQRDPTLVCCFVCHTHRYGIIYQKGYQKTGNVAGTVTTKMKGAYLLNDTDDFDGCGDYFSSPYRVFDPADYVIPPQVCGLLICYA